MYFLDDGNIENEPVDLILAVDNSDYSNDGMKSTEERLNNFNFRDDRLKVLHFVDRSDYITYLRNGHVFLSCSRSEGWNLPLIEAMACGTPSIYSNWSGQLQFAEGKGHPVKVLEELPVPGGIGNYIEPDFDDLSKVMRDVYTNFWNYKADAIKESDLKDLSIYHNNRYIKLDVSQMFNPNYSGELNKSQFKIEKHKEFFILYGFFSDGAGTYTTNWTIKDGKSKRSKLSNDDEDFNWQLTK